MRLKFIKIYFRVFYLTILKYRNQWPRCLRCGSAVAGLLGSWLRIPPGTWMSVCCECCVLSGRDLCFGLITRKEEFYRVCVSECDREALIVRRPWPTSTVAPSKER
jgi:hypothetical protein